MRKPWVQWTLAVVITLIAAIYQRRTGPTYPARGSVELGGQAITLTLLRTHSITGRQPVTVTVADTAVTGTVEWRRFPTDDAWITEQMWREGDVLSMVLPPPPEPLMPMAGKLAYRVTLTRGAEAVSFPEQPAITRFKGDVPMWVLIPHVLCMFFGMLFAMRALFAAVGGGDTRRWGFTTTALLLLGGFVLGPIVQKHAFDAYWTGVPFGYDLTDNKTLIAGVSWILAALRMRGGRQAKLAVIIATIVTMVVFAIPHSMWGSQAKW
ncbi:MAG: hypothetical protein HY944_00095 [Gemmatimonadetes bacterium]|nr:hypothetical protein [Gemmatimonadota bacterium]